MREGVSCPQKHRSRRRQRFFQQNRLIRVVQLPKKSHRPTCEGFSLGRGVTPVGLQALFLRVLKEPFTPNFCIPMKSASKFD